MDNAQILKAINFGNTIPNHIHGDDFYTPLKLAYQPKNTTKIKPQISSANDIFDILYPVFKNDINLEESFVVLLLNRSNTYLGHSILSTGGFDGCVVDVRKLFSIALLSKASAIVVAHNHPSGNLKPSSADINITKKIKEAGKLLDITLLDHLIMVENNFYSFANEGLL